MNSNVLDLLTDNYCHLKKTYNLYFFDKVFGLMTNNPAFKEEINDVFVSQFKQDFKHLLEEELSADLLLELRSKNKEVIADDISFVSRQKSVLNIMTKNTLTFCNPHTYNLVLLDFVVSENERELGSEEYVLFLIEHVQRTDHLHSWYSNLNAGKYGEVITP